MSFGASDKNNGASSATAGYGQAQGSRLRGRNSGSVSTPRLSGNSVNGLMPTPAPTISSAMSDEDVALQLIRLGDPSNLSLGRTPTDDALSGKADAASSSEDDDVDRPTKLKRTSSAAGMTKSKKKKLPRLQTNIGGVGPQDSEEEDESDEGYAHVSKHTSKTPAARPKASAKSKHRQMSNTHEPPSHLASGRESLASSANSPSALGMGDDDLSALPRCQRCRKSKKGCDRQRPCGRCKDAGIGIEGCISEDEGNGRKGRYGRHMGVALGKTDGVSVGDPGIELPPVADFKAAIARKK